MWTGFERRGSAEIDKCKDGNRVGLCARKSFIITANFCAQVYLKYASKELLASDPGPRCIRVRLFTAVLLGVYFPNVIMAA